MNDNQVVVNQKVYIANWYWLALATLILDPELHGVKSMDYGWNELISAFIKKFDGLCLSRFDPNNNPNEKKNISLFVL